MNEYSQRVIWGFTSPENLTMLFGALNKMFNSHLCYKFLMDNSDVMVKNFVNRMQKEMYLSDPMPNASIISQVLRYNDLFMKDKIDFILKHVEVSQERPDRYKITDNEPTSRDEFERKPNDKLAAWYNNACPAVQTRDDSQQKGAYKLNPYAEGTRNNIGIDFCDQSNNNTSQHLAQFADNSYIQSLNRVTPENAYTFSAFGDATIASDKRLQERRIFRSNEAGVENGIPRYESRLYAKPIERNISEGLRSSEMDCKLSGYDETSLFVSLRSNPTNVRERNYCSK